MQEKGKVREGCCWAADPREKAASCAEQEDNVGPARHAAGVHSVVRRFLGPEGTWWEALDAKQKPEVVGSVRAVVSETVGASLEPLRGSTSHWAEQAVAAGAGQAFARPAETCWVEDAVLDVLDAAGVLRLGAAEAKRFSAGGPEDRGPSVVVRGEAWTDASLDERAGWGQAYSFVTPAASVDLMGAFAPWGHRASACLGGVESAGYLGTLGVGVGTYDADGEAYWAASFGWGGAGRVEVWPEKLGASVDGPEEASAWNLAPSVGAAEAHSPGESGSLAAFGVAADADGQSGRDAPAGTVGEHQAEGAGIRAGSLAGPDQEAEGWEQPSDQAGTPEAAAGHWAEGTVAAAASAAVVGIQEFGPEHDWGLSAEAYSGGKSPSEEVRRSQMRLQV